MIDKMIRLLVLLTVTMGLARTEMLGAEPLPPRALARIGDHRFYHGPGIECAALSPDGRRVASSASYPDYYHHITAKERNNYDSVIILWDAASGERLRELRVPHAPTKIADLAFSPDGTRLAAAYGISEEKTGVGVFAVETGELLWPPMDFQRTVTHLQFSADSRQLHLSELDGPVSAWDAVSGKQLRLWVSPFEVPPKGAKQGAIDVRGLPSPDGKVIAWYRDSISENGVFREPGELRVHDVATGKLLYQIKLACVPSLNFLTFALDGKRFAADCRDKIIVWETATGKQLAAIKIPDLWQFCLAPNGQQAVICEFSGELYSLHLWDLQTGKPSRKFSPGFVPGALFIPRKQQIFSADGKTLLLAEGRSLRLFDTTTGKEKVGPVFRTSVKPHFFADGRTLFTFCDDARHRWNVSPGKEPALLRQERTKIWEAACLAYSADQRLFLDCAEGRVRVRETATGHIRRELGNYDRHWTTSYSRFSRDAAHVLVEYKRSDDKNPSIFHLYETKTGKALGEFKATGFENSWYCLRDHLIADRLIAWVDHAGNVHLHDAATGKAVRTLRSSRPLPKGGGDDSTDLLFSPDGGQLVVAIYLYDFFKPDGERKTALPLRVFQVSNGREIARFYANPDKKSKAARLSWMASSPDGRLLAVAEDESGIVRLIEIASGKARVEFAGHRHGVRGLSFSSDGRSLASGGEDNVVFLWDVTGARTQATVNTASDNDLAAWWNDLASDDGKRAGGAITGLLRKSEASVAFLQPRLHPAESPDQKWLARLLADLDSDAYQTREAASRELVRLGERAEAALRRAWMNRPSLEMRRRIEDVLNKLEPSPPPPETLRMLRAIEVLEHIGTAQRGVAWKRWPREQPKRGRRARRREHWIAWRNVANRT